MTINEIKQLIANDEHRTLELKKSTSELVKGMQTLCAFLNTDGGWLIFGVTPKLEVLGQNVTDNTQREIAHEMTKIEPAISLPIEIIDIPERPGCSVIAIHCEPAQFGDAPTHTMDGHSIKWKAQPYKYLAQCLRNVCAEAIQADLLGKAKQPIICNWKIWMKDVSRGL